MCCEETLNGATERSACVNLIDLERADIALFIMYSLKRLACATFPGFFEKEKKEKTRYARCLR